MGKRKVSGGNDEDEEVVAKLLKTTRKDEDKKLGKLFGICCSMSELIFYSKCFR